MRSVYQVFSFDVLSKVLTGLVGILLIRYMPEGEYATYTVAISFVAIIIQGFVAAFNRIYILEYDGLQTKGGDAPFLAVQLAGILVVSAIALPFLRSLGLAFGAAVLVVLANSMSDFTKTVFQRQLRFKRYSLTEVGRSLLFMTLVVSLVKLAPSHLKATNVLLAQAIAMYAAFYAVFRSRLLTEALRSMRTVGVELRALLFGESRYLFLYFVVLALFAQLDIFLLRSLGTTRQLATYGSAFRYYTLLSLALGAVHTVLLPTIQLARDTDEIAEVLRRQRSLSLVFVPLVAVGAWLSGWLIPLIDRGRYPDAVPTFRILAVSAVISFIFSPSVNLVLCDREYRFLFRAVCASLVIGVPLNLVLIPAFGAPGAAVATLVAFGLFNGAVHVRATRNLAAPRVAVPAPTP